VNSTFAADVRPTLTGAPGAPRRRSRQKPRPYAVLLDALETSTVSAPKNALSARKSSIRNEVMKSGRSSAINASSSTRYAGSPVQRR
jgi:hypothetical protein